MPGFLDQTVKPHRITATFYSHNRRPRQLRVKPTHVVVLVIEFPLMQLPIARVHPAHHLRADMQVHSEVECSHLCLLARARPANLAGPGWGEPTPLAPGGAFLMTSPTKTGGGCTNNSHSGTHPAIKQAPLLTSNFKPLTSPFSHSCALFCTFLHSRKTQLHCFQSIPHSLFKTPAVGEGCPTRFSVFAHSFERASGKHNSWTQSGCQLALGGKTIFQNSGAGASNSTGTSDPS